MTDNLMDEIYKMSERQIKDISFNRRAIEILGGDASDYDSKLNEWCDKYYRFFYKMDEQALSKYMAEETIRMLSKMEV